MLLVKDYGKLTAHGFKPVLYHGAPTGVVEYVLKTGDNYRLSILVNPCDGAYKKDELAFFAGAEDDDETCTDGVILDECAKIDIIAEMLMDGTIIYVKEPMCAEHNATTRKAA